MSNESASAGRRRLVRVFGLREQPGDDISRSTTAEERVAMVWPLTIEAWLLTGERCRLRLPGVPPSAC